MQWFFCKILHFIFLLQSLSSAEIFEIPTGLCLHVFLTVKHKGGFIYVLLRYIHGWISRGSVCSPFKLRYKFPLAYETGFLNFGDTLLFLFWHAHIAVVSKRWSATVCWWPRYFICVDQILNSLWAFNGLFYWIVCWPFSVQLVSKFKYY